MDNYTFGECKSCFKCEPLKNGLCLRCENDTPEFFRDLFGGVNKKKE